MMRRWLANVGGWLFGAILAAYITVPWIAERAHRGLPVYGPPMSVVSMCDAARLVFTGKAKKLSNFDVLSNEEPGWLIARYLRDDRGFIETYPLVTPDGEVVVTRPAYVAGDEFTIGPFAMRAPEGATSIEVGVVLPGIRWGFHRTTAIIGPISLPPCS